MEFFEVVHKRRAVRKFTQDPVPASVIEAALDAALAAPTSSNIQAWEFYWVRQADKKAQLVEACFAQGAASTAAELIVAVSRVDTWRRNRDMLLHKMQSSGKVPEAVLTYYQKLVPVSYVQDPFGVLAVLKKILFTAVGIFRPAPRSPAFRSDLFNVVTKSTALACENLMLALVAQGFDSCPMEGFDESRVKKVLGLNRHCQVVMVLGIGKAHPEGIFGPRIRLDRSLFVKEV